MYARILLELAMPGVVINKLTMIIRSGGMLVLTRIDAQST